MAFYHGVKTSEATSGIFAVRSVESALPFVVGTAPSGAPVNKPTLINNYQEFIAAFKAVPEEEDESDYTLHLFARVFFTLYGVGPVVFVNVFDPVTHVAGVEAVLAADIVGGIDGETGERTGLELIEEVFPLTGKVPTLIVCPGMAHEATVITAMVGKAEGYYGGLFKAIALVDGDPADVLPADVVTSKGTVTSEHAFFLWPQVNTSEPLSVHAAGVIARTDLQYGGIPFASPSNKTLNITGPAVVVTKDVADQLNEAGITTAFRFSQGFKLWGNRTCAYPEVTDPKDAFLSVRRMFDFLEMSLTLATWQKVDDPTNKALIRSVVVSINQALNGWVARGALLSGQVVFSDQDNPVVDLASGIIKFRITATPPLPAESIEYVFELDTSAFETLFN